MTNIEFINFCLVLKRPTQEVHRELISMSNHEINFLHGAIGACGETGELLDIAKKRLIYGKEIDTVHVIEEVGDTLHYLTYVCDAVGITFEECMEANKRKLLKRYPEGFKTTDALSRDLEAEREQLENDT